MRYAILESRLFGPHTMQPQTFLEKAEANDFRDDLDRRFTQRGGASGKGHGFFVVRGKGNVRIVLVSRRFI